MLFEGFGLQLSGKHCASCAWCLLGLPRCCLAHRLATKLTDRPGDMTAKHVLRGLSSVGLFRLQS